MARVDATADDVVHEVDHVRQLDDGPMAAEIRRLHAGGLDEWDQRSVRDRLELFRTKLAIELDAAQRQVDEAAGGTDAEATLAARATLTNLRGLEREVDALTDVEVSEMSAGRREEPAYLRDPAWLFAKERVVVGTRPGRHAVLDNAPRVVLPRAGRDRSPAWDSRADVLGVYRVGDEWREVVLVSSDHAGSVTVRDDGADGQTVVVTDTGGARHPYVLEPGAELLVEDGARVAAGTGLANERNRRYRRVEIEHAAGKDTREEVHAAHGIWMQRGSESTRRGAIMEEAARRQVDARLAAAGIAPVGDGQPLGYRRITQGRGGGGFDDVVVIFSGSPDAPEAFIRIREVKDYPNRYVPLEEFSAIRPPNLQKNLEALESLANDAVRRHTEHQPVDGPMAGLSVDQLRAFRRAIKANSIQVEVVLGPTTKVAREGAGGASVLRDLRSEIRAARQGADVLVGNASGLDPDAERIEQRFADAATNDVVR